VKILSQLPRAMWRTFVAEHPHGNVFHTPEMFDVWQATKGYEPEVWAAVEAEDVVALLVPVHISLSNGLLRRLTTRTVVFGGALCQMGARGRQGLQELLNAYKQSSKRKSLFTEIRNVSAVDGVAPVLLEAGFEYEEHLNYLIDLEASAEAVFNRIGSRTRQHIRKGIKRNNVRVQEVHERGEIAVCYELLSKTYRRANVPLADLSLFHAAFDRLVPAHMARFALAFVEEEPAAVSVELVYKDSVYGWYGGVDRRFISSVPGELLMWNVLEWGCQSGYQTYDFGGAGKPGEKYGVRDFKAKFGGRLVCFGRNIWVSNPTMLAGSKFAYGILRRVMFRN
jgi:CelD/BcsL family acetyltransferase involved in cellulose biosynthesis